MRLRTGFVDCLVIIVVQFLFYVFILSLPSDHYPIDSLCRFILLSLAQLSDSVLYVAQFLDTLIDEFPII